MPSNYNNVCFECRVTFKHPGACPHCRKGLFSCGKKWRFPKKSDVKGWKKIFEMVMKNPYVKEIYENRSSK